MNVLILNASPRKKGITSTLLTELKSTINSTHHPEIIRIQELKIKPCIGCLKCRPDKTCILPQDDSHILAEKIEICYEYVRTDCVLSEQIHNKIIQFNGFDSGIIHFRQNAD